MSRVRVLAFGAWDRGPGYPRADALLAAWRQAGAAVCECRFELPYPGPAKRRLLRSPWLWPGYWLALRRARRHARRRFEAELARQRPDLVLVPYPGHLVVRWVRSWFDGPVVLDLFLSAYDTVVIDRAMVRPGSLPARYLQRLDRRACAAADRVLVDTPANVDFVAELCGLPTDRLLAVPVSDPAEAPAPPPYRPPAAGERLEVLFFGTGVPLHGLEHLLAAVGCTPGVRLTLVGGSAADREQARALPAVRVLDEFVPAAELQRQLAECHVVAGVFGTSAKADRVVPFKVMQGLAAGRPVLTARTRAACQVLREGVEGLLVPPGDPAAIAEALCRLVAAPEMLTGMAVAARALYDERFSLAATGRILATATDGGADATPAPADELVEVG